MKDLTISKSEELVIVIFTLIILAYDFMTADIEFESVFELMYIVVFAGLMYLISITIIILIGKAIIKKINEWFKE